MFLSLVCRELSPILEESADLRAVGNRRGFLKPLERPTKIRVRNADFLDS